MDQLMLLQGKSDWRKEEKAKNWRTGEKERKEKTKSKKKYMRESKGSTGYGNALSETS